MRTPVLDELCKDHECLRSKLALLEEWLPLAHSQPEAVRQCIRTTVDGLRAHMALEGIVLDTAREQLGRQPDPAVAALLDDYAQRRQAVAVLWTLVAKALDGPIQELAACAIQFIRGAQEQMAEEELRLFPALQSRLADSPAYAMFLRLHNLAVHPAADQPPVDAEPERPATITLEMTVKQILTAHPSTARIFQAFAVGVEADAHCMLGDLKWRRNTDVSALLLALNQALHTQDRPALLTDLLWRSCDGIMIIDAHRRILAMNPSIEALLGRRAQDVVGQRECGFLMGCRDLRGCGLTDRPERCPGLHAMQRLKPVQAAEYTISAAGNRRITVSASYTPIQLVPGGPVWAVVLVRDISAQRRLERLVTRAPGIDEMTALPDRAQFLDEGAKALAHAARYRRPIALVLGSVRDFPRYVRAHGRPAGDELLKRIAGVLRAGLRSTEMVARYAEDTFAMLLPETDVIDALVVADRLGQSLAEFPFLRQEGGLWAPPPRVVLRFGAAAWPGDAATVEALLAKAEQRLDEDGVSVASRIRRAPGSAERRRQRRAEITAPARLSVCPPGANVETAEPAREAVIKNLSLTGAYLTVEPDQPVSPNDIARVAVEIPESQQRDFSYSRLTSHGRIVRVDELASRAGQELKRLGVAIEFGDDVTVLAASPDNGH